MEQQAANARWARLHEARQWHDGTLGDWAEKPSPEHPYHRDHGVTIGVSETDVRPTDAFLTQERAPWPPPTAEDSVVAGGADADLHDPGQSADEQAEKSADE